MTHDRREDAVTLKDAERETRTPMTWEAYLELDDGVPGEYFGGAFVVSAAPGRRHQDIVLELARALQDSVDADSAVTIGWGWSPTGVRQELIPDLMVHPATEEDTRYTGVPLLVVEVVSRHRRTDFVEKTTRYASWGARSSWIVDPRDHEVHTYDNHDGLFEQTGRFDGGRVRLTFGDRGVEVDLDALLR